MTFRPTFSSLLLILASLGAPIAFAPPASAQALDVDDAAADVWEGHYSDDGQLLGWSKAGSTLNTDIIATTVVHGPKRITLTTQYDDLRKEDLWFRTQYDLRVEGLAQTVHVDVSAYRRWQGVLSVYTVQDGYAADVRCDRMDHRIDYRRDTVRFRIARGCLDSPAWLRVTSFAAAELMSEPRYFRDVYDSGRHALAPPSRRVRAGQA